VIGYTYPPWGSWEKLSPFGRNTRMKVPCVTLPHYPGHRGGRLLLWQERPLPVRRAYLYSPFNLMPSTLDSAYQHTGMQLLSLHPRAPLSVIQRSLDLPSSFTFLPGFSLHSWMNRHPGSRFPLPPPPPIASMASLIACAWYRPESCTRAGSHR
jgi:hypothetical protein